MVALQGRRDRFIVQRMGFMDKAKEMLGKHDDKVDQGLDKAGEAAKGRFAGQEENIDKGVDQLQGMTGQGDTTQSAATEGAPAGGAPPEGAPPGGVPPEGVPPEGEPRPGEERPPQQ
jgi:hypothetical protein